MSKVTIEIPLEVYHAMLDDVPRMAGYLRAAQKEIERLRRSGNRLYAYARVADTHAPKEQKRALKHWRRLAKIKDEDFD